MTFYIFEFPYKVLTSLGLWSTDSKNRMLNIVYCTYQTWAFLFLSVFTCFLLWDLYLVREDVHKASTNLSATMTVLMLLWKNTQGLQRLPRVRQLQKELTKGLHEEEDERDQKIMRRAVLEMSLACVAVYLMGFGTMTSWVASGVLKNSDDEEEKTLPLPVWVPWNYQTSPSYQLSLLFQAYGGYFVTFDVLSLNLTIFGTVIQICAEFDILLKNTDMVSEWYKNTFGERRQVMTEYENLIVGKMIVRNIQHHQRIIHCAKEAENCYVHMMVVQFAGSSLLITVVFLDLILVTRELNSRVYPLLIFLLLVTSDIYLFCHYGSRLLNKSNELLERVYGMPWELMNSKNRKIISIIIMQTQRPAKLTVEKIADIDFYSLLQLTKIVYNVLYLLLHLAKDRK